LSAFAGSFKERRLTNDESIAMLASTMQLCELEVDFQP
jgi:hypothetical protein